MGNLSPHWEPTERLAEVYAPPPFTPKVLPKRCAISLGYHILLIFTDFNHHDQSSA